MVPVLVALSAWGDDYVPLDGGPGIVYVTKGSGRRVHVDLVDDEGHAVDPADVEVVAGPGYEAALAS
jgi:hypothetical protein